MIFKRPIIFSLLMVCVLLVACSEDEPKSDKSDNTRIYGGEITYLANGQVIGVTNNSIYVAQGMLRFESLSGSKVQFSFSVDAGIAETSYELKKDVVSMVYYTADRKDNYFYYEETPAGEVVITEIDEVNKTMSGTFSGDLKNSVDNMVVANGIFTNVPYVVQNEDPEGERGTLQIAKLDGSDFIGGLYSYGMSGHNYGFTFASGEQLLEFNLPENLEAGTTYDVSQLNESLYEGIKFVDGLYSYKATSGTVTITEFTAGKHIKGTFSVKAESYPLERTPRSFTEGSFDVTL